MKRAKKPRPSTNIPAHSVGVMPERCTNPICGPARKTIECCPGSYQQCGMSVPGIDGGAAIAILRARPCRWEPRVGRPQASTYRHVYGNPEGAPPGSLIWVVGRSFKEDARAYWEALRLAGYVD